MLKGFLQQFKRDYIISCAASVLVGAVFLVFPTQSLLYICYIIASVFCLLGVIRLIAYFRKAPSATEYQPNLVLGLLFTGLGVYLFASPDALLNTIPTLLGVVLIFSGLVKLQNGLDMLRLKAQRWWIMLVLAAISVILGVLAILDPFAAQSALILFIGISLILNGITDLATILILSSRIKHGAQAVEEAVSAAAQTAASIIPAAPAPAPAPETPSVQASADEPQE